MRSAEALSAYRKLLELRDELRLMKPPAYPGMAGTLVSAGNFLKLVQLWCDKVLPIIQEYWPKKFNQFQELMAVQIEQNASGSSRIIYASNEILEGAWLKDNEEGERIKKKALSFLDGLVALQAVIDMFENILLEPEQKELLAFMVETIRKIPRDQREMFMMDQAMGSDELIYLGGTGDSKKIFKGDLEVLISNGLVSMSSSNYYLPPEGFAFYDFMKRQAGESVADIESEIKTHLEGREFRQRYPLAYKKWSEAEEKVWNSDSKDQQTVIGHLCREAFQEFVTVLVDNYNPPNVETNKARDVSRLKAVLEIRSTQLGQTEAEFLKALIEYYGAVNDLVQRQEHGGQKEGRPIVWEDSRRVVFNVAFVMFEIDKAIGQKI